MEIANNQVALSNKYVFSWTDITNAIVEMTMINIFASSI